MRTDIAWKSATTGVVSLGGIFVLGFTGRIGGNAVLDFCGSATLITNEGNCMLRKRGIET